MTRYLSELMITALWLCGTVAIFNYVVDPYAIHHIEKADEEYLSRTDRFWHMRTTKPWRVRQLKPSAVIVGSSRTASIHPGISSGENQRSYNVSVPGMTMYEMYRFIQHSYANQPLNKLVIGLDFEIFMLREPKTRTGFAENRFARSLADLDSPNYKFQYGVDIAATLFSLSALSRSVAAMAGTGNARQHRYFVDGAWISTGNLLKGESGYLFVAKGIFDRYVNNEQGMEDNLATFAAILRFCLKENIDTRIFITPAHVFHLDFWQELGYKKSWQKFHHDLVAMNSRVTSEFNKNPFPLWGFNQTRGVINEPITRHRQTGESWFRDGVHYQTTLGSRIMNSMWGEEPSMGTLLTEKTVDPYLVEVDRIMTDFVRDNPRIIQKRKEQICLEISRQAGKRLAKSEDFSLLGCAD